MHIKIKSPGRNASGGFSEVLRVVDDALRVVLVLDLRQALRVRGVVPLVRDVRRVRAVDIVRVLLEGRIGLLLLDRGLHALDELDSVGVLDRARDRAVVLDRVQRIASVERVEVRGLARHSRLAATVEVTVDTDYRQIPGCRGPNWKTLTR